MVIEVHPQHKPLQSIKEFLVHMLAITLGLMIALSMEAGVVWYEHRALAREARRNIAAEMRTNQQELADSRAALNTEDDELQRLLDFTKALRKDRKTPPPTITLNIRLSNLNRSSWDTAATMGAPNYMKYDSVKAYEDVYSLQQDFENLQRQRLQAWLTLNAMVSDQDASQATEPQISAFDQQARIVRASTRAAISLETSLDQLYTRTLATESQRH
jgi:hypothetical protein